MEREAFRRVDSTFLRRSTARLDGFPESDLPATMGVSAVGNEVIRQSFE
jgi:hypothetical protein